SFGARGRKSAVSHFSQRSGGSTMWESLEIIGSMRRGSFRGWHSREGAAIGRAPPGGLVRQEPLLAPEPTRVAGQTSIGTDDAMARDHDRDWIRAVRRTHRAGRAGSADGAGELAVRRGPARRNLAQRVPHSTLEGRPLEVDRDPGERLDVAGEVPLEASHQTGG